MDHSPKGRAIELLVGDAPAIDARGRAITTLGEQMISSASMLKAIADGASGQEGLAVDKLQEVVGATHAELKLAGERYKPTGPVLVTYAEVLAEVQPLIKRAVEDCTAEWSTFSAKSSAVWDARTDFYPQADPVDGCAAPKTAEELRTEAVQDAQGAADLARGDWEQEARTFDSHYDTWEAAFDTAAAAIGEATDGGIQDGFWDNVDGFVAGMLEVLKWVGLALAILGAIIGGPFIAALAAIVAITTLLLTIYQFSRGDADGWDLAWAIVGVIPFGSMGKLFQTGKRLDFVNDAFGGLLRSSTRGNIIGELAGIRHGLVTGFSRGGGGLVGLGRGLRGGGLAWAGPNGMGAGNIASRLFTGQNLRDLTTSSDLISDIGRFGVKIPLKLNGLVGKVETVGDLFFGSPEAA